MPESLLNFRFRRTTLKYQELLIALEKHHRQGSTAGAIRQKKVETRAPMEIEMAGGMTGKVREKSWTSHCKLPTKEQEKATGDCKASKLEHTEGTQVAKDANCGGKRSWQ